MKASKIALDYDHNKAGPLVRSPSFEDPGFRRSRHERGPYIYIPSPIDNCVHVFRWLVMECSANWYAMRRLIFVCLSNLQASCVLIDASSRSRSGRVPRLLISWTMMVIFSVTQIISNRFVVFSVCPVLKMVGEYVVKASRVALDGVHIKAEHLARYPLSQTQGSENTVTSGDRISTFHRQATIA